jgi:phosphohistidine phosphatase
MDCILFRHGIAVDPKDWTGKEDLRPLTPDGRKKTRNAAAGLCRLDLAPTHLWSSPLTRAVQTAELLRQALQLHHEIRLLDELRSDAPPELLLPLLQAIPAESCLICVGHEPHLGALASVMLFGKSNGGLSLKKAGACLIHFDERPKAGRGTLGWWLMPSQLRSLAKT